MWPSWRLSPQLPEKRPDVLDEEIRDLQRGKVARRPRMKRSERSRFGGTPIVLSP
jgi:hypothetical protein